MGVSKNHGTPKSSILIGFSINFTIHFGVPLFLETPIIYVMLYNSWYLQPFKLRSWPYPTVLEVGQAFDQESRPLWVK